MAIPNTNYEFYKSQLSLEFPVIGINTLKTVER